MPAPCVAVRWFVRDRHLDLESTASAGCRRPIHPYHPSCSSRPVPPAFSPPTESIHSIRRTPCLVHYWLSTKATCSISTSSSSNPISHQRKPRPPNAVEARGPLQPWAPPARGRPADDSRACAGCTTAQATSFVVLVPCPLLLLPPFSTTTTSLLDSPGKQAAQVSETGRRKPANQPTKEPSERGRKEWRRRRRPRRPRRRRRGR